MSALVAACVFAGAIGRIIWQNTGEFWDGLLVSAFLITIAYMIDRGPKETTQ